MCLKAFERISPCSPCSQPCALGDGVELLVEIHDHPIRPCGREALEGRGKNIRYADLCRLCDHFFGEPRQQGTSHRVYKTPWHGLPRVNIQEDRGGKAKPYQVRQVAVAIRRLREEHGTEEQG